MTKEGEEKEEENILQNWYKKRKLSLVIIYMHDCLYMFEISAVSVSALYYFKYTIKSPNPRLYFSLVTTAVFVLAPFSSVLVGRYVDRTRDLRKTLFVLAIFNVVGNLMYIFPVYDWFPIAGRILCGVPEGIRASFKGEISRTYPSSETTKLLSNLLSTALVFRIIAPSSTVIFKNISFNLFGFVINQYNFIGFFLLIATFVYVVLAYFLLCNTSKEPGYKVFKRINGEGETEEDTQSVMSVKDLLTDPSIVIILITNFIYCFNFANMEVALNFVAIDLFHWNIQRLGITSLCAAGVSVVVMKLAQRLHTSINIYFICIIYLLGNCVKNLIFNLGTIQNIQNGSLQIAFVSITIFFNVVMAYGLTSFTTPLIFLYTKDNSKCFVAGFQVMLIKLGGGAGFLTSTLMFENGEVAYTVSAVVFLLLALLYIARSQHFLRRFVYLKSKQLYNL